MLFCYCAQKIVSIFYNIAQQIAWFILYLFPDYCNICGVCLFVFYFCSAAEVNWSQVANRLTEKVCSQLKQTFQTIASYDFSST